MQLQATIDLTQSLSNEQIVSLHHKAVKRGFRTPDDMISAAIAKALSVEPKKPAKRRVKA